MGFFDRFRRKPKDDLKGLLDGLPEPRTQHYVFAHIAMRQLAFENPTAVVGTLHMDDGPKFLRSVWDDVAEQVRKSGEPADIDSSGLAVHPLKVGNFPCAVVRMPPPIAPAECHYVAMVLHVKLGEAGVEESPENPQLSYFTLERGIQLEGGERTVLCGWDAQGTHMNFGDGPPVGDAEAFAAAMVRVMRP